MALAYHGRDIPGKEGMMETHRFDALSRNLTVAGSRRRVFIALLMGTVGQTFQRSPVDDVVARRKRGKGRRKRKKKKKPEQQPECGGIESPPCPPETPCCIEGTCQPLCGGVCCADCFVEILLQTGQPDFDHPFCCPASGGTVCSPGSPVLESKKKKKRKKGKKRGKSETESDDPSDDVCCYSNEVCVNGACCCNGCQGAMVCGGTCCAIAACCNGQCCESGTVCATTPAGQACVSANRGCSGNQDCFSGEVCHGGVCCSGGRICTDGEGGDVCCGVGARCELPNNVCCPINTACQTYKGRRVRR
jgi:hypothetical protein